MRGYRSALASSKAKLKSTLRPLLGVVRRAQPGLPLELWDLVDPQARCTLLTPGVYSWIRAV